MTTRIALLLATALLLLTAGVVLWWRADDAGRLAAAQRTLVTLQFEQAAGAAETRGAARYWSGEYSRVKEPRDRLLAANAAYRAALRPGGSAKDVVTRLDGVVKQYADVLRQDPGREDAAYNYEFVVRYRAAIASRGASLPPVPDDARSSPHGRVGAPARGTGQQQFRMLVPMQPDERREAEEAGKAGRRIRKG